VRACQRLCRVVRHQKCSASLGKEIDTVVAVDTNDLLCFLQGEPVERLRPQHRLIESR